MLMNLNLFMNKDMKKIFLGIMAASLVGVACNTQMIETPVQYGKLSLALEGEPLLEVETKAYTELSASEAANYNVAVYENSECTGTPVIGPVKFSAFGTQTIQTGKTYYVFAESCTEAEAESYENGKGQLRLAGKSAGVSITADDLEQTATVQCDVANAMVTVAFDQTVFGTNGSSRFTDLNVNLSSSETSKNRNMAVSNSETVNYFNPCTLTYNITGTYTETGKSINVSKTVDLPAKKNLRIVVKVNLENGQLLTPSIEVDTTIDNITEIDEAFNPYN